MVPPFLFLYLHTTFVISGLAMFRILLSIYYVPGPLKTFYLTLVPTSE